MTDTDLIPELLVPPRRLGALLASTRIERGLSLAEAADALGDGWGSLDLLEVEAGRRPVSDSQILNLTSLYGIGTTDLVPARSRLVVDMQERTLAAAGRTVELGRGRISRRQVLGRYLAMICAMRGIEPGEPLALRRDDLDVLAMLFSTTPEQIRVDLDDAVRRHHELVEPWTQRLKGRVMVPTLGVVVAATAFGTLLLAAGDTGAQPALNSSAPSAPTTQVEVQIGDAVMQERLPDGTPGPVVIRD